MMWLNPLYMWTGEVVVTTPHSLLRCLKHHGLLLLRLCHLVLDEVDLLFSKAGPEVSRAQLYEYRLCYNKSGNPLVKKSNRQDVNF